MDPIIAQLGAAGVTVAVLLGGMAWLSKQYVATRKELRESAKACSDREAGLIQRLQSLEDSRTHDLVETIQVSLAALRETTVALRTNAEAFKQWTEDESGQHRSQNKGRA